MDFIHKAATLLTSPLVHVPALIVLSLLINQFFRLKRFFKVTSFLSLLWLLFCSMTYTSVLLVYPLEHKYPMIEANSDSWKHADAIVVLACYYYDDDELPFVSRWPDCSMKRNLQAWLMYQHSARKIIVTGGGLADSEHSLAYYNGQFLIHLGVDPSDILIVSNGKNTASEANSLSLHIPPHGHTIALIAAATQMHRAANYFESAGYNVIAVPVEHLSKKKQKFTIGLPNARSLYRSERAIHEYLGLMKQQLFE